MCNYKLLSIIIPTYNMERYLPRCLDSLINTKEALSMLEILVINDGSKDISSQIAHRYQEQYPDSIVVIDKENGNYGSCVNRGLEEATGKYVKVLDADDWFDNNKLTSFLLKLEKCNSDLILTDYSQVFGDNSKKAFSFPYEPEKEYDNSIMVTSAFKELQMHAVAYKRQLLLDLNYRQTEGISYTDQEWIFMPMSKVNTISYYNLDLYQYFIGREGQTMSPQLYNQNINQRIIVSKNIINQFSKIENNLDSNHYVYLKHRIIFMTTAIYKAFLFSLTDANIDLLHNFDEFIKRTNYSIYMELDDIPIKEKIPYKYINYYHKSHKRAPLLLSQLYKIWINHKNQ